MNTQIPEKSKLLIWLAVALPLSVSAWKYGRRCSRTATR
jgi:hypothetical protein